MAKQDIDLGSGPGAGDGEILFDAFSKCVNNFDDNFRDIALLIATVNAGTPPATFNMVGTDDTKVAVIGAVTGLTYAEHQIVIDDDTQPTVGDPNWVATPVVSSLTAADWLLHTYYLWVKQADDTILQVPPVDPLSDQLATPGLLFQANDSVGPVWVATGLQMNGTAYTLTQPTDASSGLAATNTYDIYVDGVPAKTGFTALTGTVNIPSDGNPHDVTAYARDAQLNSSASNSVQVTIQPATDGGTVGFVTTRLDITEGDAGVFIQLTRTGGTGEADVTISTIADTALPVTNYTALVAEPVHWNAGETGIKQVALSTVNVPSSVNNQLFVVIDYGSGNVDNVTISQESMRVVLGASGATGFSGFQMADTSPFWLPLEAESYYAIRNSIAAGKTTDQYAISNRNLRKSSFPLDPLGGFTMDNLSGSNYGDNIPELLDTEAPYLQYEMSIPAAAVTAAVNEMFDIFARCTKSGEVYFARNCHFTLLRPIASIGANGSGGGTDTLVTLEYAHGHANGDVVFLEGTASHDNADKTEAGSYAISNVTATTYTIPDVAGGSAETFPTPSIAAVSMGDATLLDFASDEVVTGNSQFRWTNGDSDPINVMIPTAGTWHLRQYAQDNSFNADKLLICPQEATNPTVVADLLIGQASSNPSLDDPFGPEQAPYDPGGSGTPPDNTDNTVTLPFALPLLGYTIPAGDKLPANAATNVTTTTTIRAIFPGMTNLQVNVFEVLDGSGNQVAGAVVPTSNSIEFTPVSPLANFATYSVVLQGRVTLSDGTTVRRIVASPWSFTTINTASSSTLFYLNFEGIRP